jgi:hypothetical protein
MTFHIVQNERTALNPPELSFLGWPTIPEMNKIFIVPLAAVVFIKYKYTYICMYVCVYLRFASTHTRAYKHNANHIL